MNTVFHIIPNLIIGGAQTFLKTLIDGLPQWNHQILILDPQVEPAWNSYPKKLVQPAQLMRLCKDPCLENAIFHFHWFPPFQFMIPDCKKSKSIVTIQDNEPCSIFNAAIYIVSTHSGLQFAPPKSQAFAIAPSININQWSNLNLQREKGLLIRHSTIYPEKLSEEMMKDICQYDFNKYRWRIIGVGNNHYLNLLKNKYIKTSKVILGASHNICEELNRSWLYVYHTPANGEHYGLCFQEALASGIPVITNDQAGAKDQIINGKNGFICKNTKEMKDKVDEIYKDDFFYNKLIINIQKINFIKKTEFFLQKYEKLYQFK